MDEPLNAPSLSLIYERRGSATKVEGVGEVKGGGRRCAAVSNTHRDSKAYACVDLVASLFYFSQQIWELWEDFSFFFLFPLHPQVTLMFQTIIAVKWPRLSIALKGELKFSGCHLKHEAETTVKSWCSSRGQILLLLFPVLWQPKVTISYKCGKQMTFQFFLGHPPALLLPSLSLSVQKDDFHSACNVDRNSVLLSPKEIHSRSKNKAWFWEVQNYFLPREVIKMNNIEWSAFATLTVWIRVSTRTIDFDSSP